MKVTITLLAMTTLIVSCQSELLQEEQTKIQDLYNNVDQELWSHFKQFEIEAQKRGYQIDLNQLQITGEIKPIAETNVAGTCRYGQHITHVTVDSDYWNRNSNAQREFVVFHELGHCVLHRDHTESSFQNGICTSMMHSGLSGCQVAYSQTNRTYYLDELFSSL